MCFDSRRSKNHMSGIERSGPTNTNQTAMISLLNSYAGHAPQNVQRIKQFLGVKECHIPRTILRSQCTPQRLGRIAMPAARVMKSDGQFAQEFTGPAAASRSPSAANDVIFAILDKTSLAEIQVAAEIRIFVYRIVV